MMKKQLEFLCPGSLTINPSHTEKNTNCLCTKSKKRSYARPYHLWDILQMRDMDFFADFTGYKKNGIAAV